jgi:uncharacterized membrane protein YphA (DoxX/SURF4 family)
MKRILALLPALTLTPLTASAHVRWFSDETVSAQTTSEPTGLYLSIWAIVAVAVVSIGIWLHRKELLSLTFLKPKRKTFEKAASIFTMIAGAFFLIAGTHSFLFSPNLTFEAGIPIGLIALQIAVGLAFLTGVGTRALSLVLIFMWLVAIPFSSLVALLENIWVLSTALFVLFMGNDYFSIISSSTLQKTFKKYKKYALPTLRIGTGATLMVLGFSEKILAPELGVNFLASHQWNFMNAIGLNFSDYLFTVSAGSAEFLLGLVLVIGIVPRLNALAIALFFSIPLFILGPIELAGHLPHIAAVVLVLLYGNGGHFLPYKTKRDIKSAPIR